MPVLSHFDAAHPSRTAIPLAGTGETAIIASVPINLPEATHHGLDAMEITSHVAAAIMAERALADAMPPIRRATFLGGRSALRTALVHAAADATSSIYIPPLLTDHRGAPDVPLGVLGSISHKRTRAIAVALHSTRGHIGIDLESPPTARDAERPSIASRILTPRELELLGTLDPLAHRHAVVLRFSLKEAIYKAIDPIVQRYVRFTEVEVDLHDDQTAQVTLLLPEFLGIASSRVPVVHAQWSANNEWIVSLARLIPSGNS